MAEPTLFDFRAPSKTKTCRRCGKTKPLDQFVANPHRRDGHTGQCKVCRNEVVLIWKRAHPEAVTAQRQRYRVSAKVRGKFVKPLVKDWEQKNPERLRVAGRARAIVRWAVLKGRLIRPERCEQCGRVAKVHGAHHDYSKPLDVRWLCPVCHGKWDKAEPKTITPRLADPPGLK